MQAYLLGKVFSVGETADSSGSSSEDDDQLLGQLLRPQGEDDYFEQSEALHVDAKLLSADEEGQALLEQQRAMGKEKRAFVDA